MGVSFIWRRRPDRGAPSCPGRPPPANRLSEHMRSTGSRPACPRPDNRPIHTPKVEKRQTIAKALLDISEAKMMLPSYEFIVVEEFMTFLAKIDWDCIRTRALYTHFREHSQQLFLGIVALLAAY